jgi:hypothetical protein
MRTRIRAWSASRESLVDRRQFATAILPAVALAGATSALAAKAPAEWDGLVRVKSKRLDNVYLLPGADFRAYTKVMLDTTEIAFHKDWQREYNRTKRALTSRISSQDVERVIVEGGKAATDIFAKAFASGGYPVVTAPGPDVLRIRTAVVNLYVTAPDTMSPGRSYSFSNEAGSATLVVEAMDSVSGAALGRAVDSRLAGDYSYMMSRTSVSNRADFANVARAWAKDSVNGLNELKRLSPVSAGSAR